MRAMIIQSDFTGGELDPKLYGRVGIPRYQSGLQTAKNVDIMVTGGAMRRAGTRFVYNAGAGAVVRQLPFVIFRTDTAPATLKGYVVEFRGDNKLRFYVDGAIILSAGVPYELATPFPGADLSLIKYEQFNSGLYLVHPDFPPCILTRTNDTSWNVANVPFNFDAALSVAGVNWLERENPKNLTLVSVCWTGTQFVAVGAADGVDAYILTSPDGITWTEQVNPKSLDLGSVSWSGTQFVAVGSPDATDAYIITSPDGIAWTERANPKALDLYSVCWSGTQFVAMGAQSSAAMGAYALKSLDGITWTELANPKNQALFSVCWSGTHFIAVGSPDGADAYIITGTSLADGGSGLSRSGQVVTATTGEVAHNFRTGNLVVIAGAGQPEYNGTFQITVVDSRTFTYVIAGTPVTPATGTITAGRVPWGATGYPSAITFFEQRLILARTKTHPQTIWGSETNNLTNFVLGVYDSSPFEFVPSAAASSINQLISTTQVVVLTNDKEITLSGGSGLPLTPSNVQIKAVGRYGSKDGIRPLPIGPELVFATRSGKRIRGMAYKLVEDSYNFPNVCIMSEHLLAAGIVEMWHATEPQSTVYLLTADGKIARVAYDREQDVVAFSRYETDGLFKGLCVVQEGLKDQVYVTVERVIGGVANTYVELFDETLNTDCAITGTDVAGKTTCTGLDHLAGEVVDVVADGLSVGPLTVAANQVVLPAAAKAVEIGLNYESELYDLKPEIPVGDGTAQGRTSASVNEIIVRLENSRGCVINGQTIPAAAAPFRGEKKISELGWSGLAGSTPAGKIPAGQVQVKQTQPLPFTVLAIIKRLSVND